MSFKDPLKQELDGLSQELNVTIVQFDIHSLLNNVIAAPEAYGFQDVTNPSIIFYPFEVEGFLFFDDVHPTTQAHKVLSEEVSTVIRDSVPAP